MFYRMSPLYALFSSTALYKGTQELHVAVLTPSTSVLPGVLHSVDSLTWLLQGRACSKPYNRANNTLLG